MVRLTTLNGHFHQYSVGIDPPSVVSTTHPTLLTVLTLLHCFVVGRGSPITMPLKSAKIGCTEALPIILLHDSSNLIFYQLPFSHFNILFISRFSFLSLFQPLLPFLILEACNSYSYLPNCKSVHCLGIDNISRANRTLIEKLSHFMNS